MRAFFIVCLVAAVVGAAFGAGLGYYDARPWAIDLSLVAPIEPGDEDDPPADGPRLAIDQPTFDFDTMERGTFKRHAFTLANEGKKPLSLTLVSKTCKCTAVELSSEEASAGDKIWIDPGQSVDAMLEWEAKQPAGPFRHGATFQTNDPDHSRFTLQVEGEVVESNTLSPAFLHFGNVQAGESAQASFYVMSFDDDEVEVLGHEIIDNDDLAKRLTLRVEDAKQSDLPSDRAANGKRIVAELDTLGGIGSFRGTLQLETNLEEAPRLVVPVSGQVRGDISIFGKHFNRDAGLLKLENIHSAQGARVELMVNVRGDSAQEAELSVASVDPEVLQVSIGEPKLVRDSLVIYPLIIAVPKGASPLVRVGDDDELGGDGEGEIVLSSTHPTTPEVRLRVRLVIKP